MNTKYISSSELKISEFSRVRSTSENFDVFNSRDEIYLGRPMRKPDFCCAKTKAQISFAVTAKLISAFVFATQIVQSLFFLNPKFQASSHLLRLYSLFCVRPGWNPNCWFSHAQAHLVFTEKKANFLFILHNTRAFSYSQSRR